MYLSSIISVCVSIFCQPFLSDPDLKWNEERGHYDFGEMDWDEFWNVVNGNGPCNKQRLAHHIKAHEDGKWVRQASKEYAKKQLNKVNS